MQETGLAHALASDLLHSLKGWPAYGVLVVVFLLGSLLTETLSNGATVVLLIPIATELAKGLHLPPMASIALLLGDHLPVPLLGTYPSLAALVGKSSASEKPPPGA
jgi:di/tricarboxylate transporter